MLPKSCLSLTPLLFSRSDVGGINMEPMCLRICQWKCTNKCRTCLGPIITLWISDQSWSKLLLLIRSALLQQWSFFQNSITLFLDTLNQQYIFFIIKMNIFWGDPSDISAKTATLFCRTQPHCTVWQSANTLAAMIRVTGFMPTRERLTALSRLQRTLLRCPVWQRLLWCLRLRT